MRKWVGVLTGSAILCAALCSQALAATDPLGFYAGAGLGVATPVNTYLPEFLRGNEFGWDAMVGIRPIEWLGAELQYMDFGYAQQQSHPFLASPLIVSREDHSHAYAAGAFAVVYWPVSIVPPPVDFFGKIGVAHLWSSDHYSISGSGVATTSFGRISQNEDDLAYGGGLQVHFSVFAFRLEYEVIDSTYSNPSLLTVGITWSP